MPILKRVINSIKNDSALIIADLTRFMRNLNDATTNLQKLLNKEVVEIKEYVLRIVIKYLVFKFDKSIVEEIFGFILLNYDINFITEEIESLVYDENEIEYEYPEDPIYKHPLFYLDLLFEKDRKDKEFRKELIRQNNEVCIPSFNKYFNQFKNEFGYTYISPNKNNDSSNYGSFLDGINMSLKIMG